MDDEALRRVGRDPRYLRLVRRRAAFGWSLTGLMLAVYFGFILLVAFAKPLLARPIAGGATSLGIPIGLGVILCAIALTAAYVRRANAEFDRALDALRRDFAE